MPIPDDIWYEIWYELLELAQQKVFISLYKALGGISN